MTDIAWGRHLERYVVYGFTSTRSRHAMSELAPIGAFNVAMSQERSA
jgi:hypothetical protein